MRRWQQNLIGALLLVLGFATPPAPGRISYIDMGGLTTTSTSTVTTTSTSTSTTTTTLAVDASYLYALTEGSVHSGAQVATGADFGTAETMYCQMIVPGRTISGINSFRWLVEESHATATFGVAFYDDDGDPQLGEGTVGYSATGLASVTLSPTVNVIADDPVLMCFCTDTTAAGDYETLVQDATAVDPANEIANVDATWHGATASTPCISGNPPATVSGLSANTFPPIQFMVGVP